MAELRFLADEHVDRAFVTASEANGFEVDVVDIHHPSSYGDERLLEFRRERESVLLTNDRDFARLGRERAHTGIVIYTSQVIPVGSFGSAVRRIDRHFSLDELDDHVLWLDQWAR